MKTYTITSGTFRMDDGSERGAGDTIELDDDVAETFKHQLREVPADTPVDGNSPEA
jgi:hypothetical protein